MIGNAQGSVDNKFCGGNTTPPDFLIVGCPRSGTTLLAVMLDRHPRLCVPPETAFWDDIAPELLEHDERKLRSVLANWRRLPELGLEVDEIVSGLPRPWRPANVFATLLRLYGRRAGKARVGEKTPQHFWHAATMLSLYPDTHVIWVLRDGREAALSMNDQQWWQPRTLSDAASLWLQSMQFMEECGQRFPGRITAVRYESLVNDPKQILSSLMTQMGEVFDPRQLDVTVPSGVVLKRSLAWKGNALQSIDVQAKYRRLLDADEADHRTLEMLLGPALRRYGYA